MPTEFAKSSPVALFLFAHQDDEFGVFQQMLIEQERGHKVVCTYFTTGIPDGSDPTQRNEESIRLLRRLGVQTIDIFFPGQLLSINDRQLSGALQVASNWFDAWLMSFPVLAAVYVPAWEGGHPDHDALHAMVAQMMHERQMIGLLRQFALYNGNALPGPFFRVLQPLAANGPSDCTTIPWKSRLRFLGYCLSYPSQTSSWVGLFPFVLLHYVFRGYQALQPTGIDRTLERPHEGILYYERRGFSSWSKLEEQMAEWRKTRQRLSDIGTRLAGSLVI